MAVYTAGFSNTSYMYLKVTATESEVSIPNNSSKVTVKVELVSQGGGYPWASDVKYPLLVQINGVTVHNANHSYSVPKGGSQTLGAYSYTVPHNSDGSKSCAIYVKFVANSTHGSASTSNSLTLTNIARASAPTLSASSQVMGNAISIYTNRASTSFSHTIEAYFGNWGMTVATGVTDGFNWTLPYTLANQIPNSVSGGGTIYLHTYNGSTLIGTKSISFTAVVPNTADFRPSFSSITHSERNSEVANKVGRYVQSLSSLNISVNGATGAYSSTIKSYLVEFNGASYSSGYVATETIYDSGTLTISATVTDSRGRTYSSATNVSVLAYSMPRLELVTVERCDIDGKLNLLGICTKVSVKASASSLKIGGVERNVTTVKIERKPRASQDYSLLGQSTFGGGLDTSYIYEGFEIEKSYDIRVTWGDQFKTFYVIRLVSTAAVPGSFGREGFGAGKVWEKGGLDVGGEAFFDNNVTVEGVTRLRSDTIFSNLGYTVGSNGYSCSIESVFNVTVESQEYHNAVCVIDILGTYTGGCIEIFFSGIQRGIAGFSGTKKVLFGRNAGGITLTTIADSYANGLTNQNSCIYVEASSDTRLYIFATSQNNQSADYSVTVKLTGRYVAML